MPRARKERTEREGGEGTRGIVYLRYRGTVPGGGGGGGACAKSLAPVITCKSIKKARGFYQSLGNTVAASSKSTDTVLASSLCTGFGELGLATVCILEWSLTSSAGGKHVPWQDNV